MARPDPEQTIRPVKYEEKLYCWFFWLEKISNPATTRWALDNFFQAPEMRVDWQTNRSKTRQSYERFLKSGKN